VPLFPRKKRGERPEAYAEPEAQPIRPPRRVGDLLRETRQGFGGSLEQIGAALRIRAAYLAAIEDGRYDQLPGPTYALGFVRTYAEHLGLDGAEIVRRYKAESSDHGETVDLSFPMPMPERGKPGAAILLVALIVAACGYATWYYLSSGERTRPERVAEVPAQLRPPPPPPALPAPEPPQVVEAEPTPPEPPLTGAQAALPPAPAPVPGAAAPVPSAPVPSATATIPPTPAPAPSVPATSAASTPARPAAPLVAPGASAPAPAVPSPASPPAQIAVAPSAPPPVPAAEPARAPAVPDVPAAAAAPEAPRVYGVTNGPARIVIKASNDSWIQVRERDNVLSVRTLKQGESYRVPDRPGLTLRTGNAGGLEISVDGKPVPPIGPSGKSRNAALDPDRLVAGRAVE
jgi:cytoskeleton protein RodZ